jgi:copper chaperone NosL
MRSIGNWWGNIMSSPGCLRARWAVLALGAVVLGAVTLGAACAPSEVMPEPLAAGQESCAFCRMTVSQPEFASQLLVPDELPKFFDDLGCLHSYLTSTTPGPEAGVIFVTDYRTREWVRADTAAYSRAPAVATPMASHLVAHATTDSRAADGALTGTTPVPIDDVVPAAWRPRQEQ